MKYKDNSTVSIEWDLFHFYPRADIHFSGDDDLIKLQENFPFQFRITDSHETFRHYKVPFKFHFWPVRKYYEKKLK